MEKEEKQYYLKQWHIVAVSALVISIIVFTASLGILVGLPALIEKNIREGAKLTDDSPLMSKWKNPKYTMKTRIWTYSVKNPDEVVNGSKPIVEKTGPYVFDQKHRREVILGRLPACLPVNTLYRLIVLLQILSNENGTVKFNHFKSFFFNHKDSCEKCDLSNKIWIPNMIFQV